MKPISINYDTKKLFLPQFLIQTLISFLQTIGHTIQFDLVWEAPP